MSESPADSHDTRPASDRETAESVTNEFASGIERPSSSANGFAAPGPAESPVENAEVLVGAAFVGGLILGRLVRRLGS